MNLRRSACGKAPDITGHCTAILFINSPVIGGGGGKGAGVKRGRSLVTLELRFAAPLVIGRRVSAEIDIV